MLQWHTGMRSGEVRIMRPIDIDRRGEVWVYRPSKHKNDWRGQPRFVVLGPTCKEVLTAFLADCAPEQYLFRPVITCAKDHYGCDTYAKAVRRAALAAGVPTFHPYQCRHAFKLRVRARWDSRLRDRRWDRSRSSPRRSMPPRPT